MRPLLRMLLIIVQPERRRHADKDESHFRRPMRQTRTQSASLFVQVTGIVRHTLVAYNLAKIHSKGDCTKRGAGPLDYFVSASGSRMPKVAGWILGVGQLTDRRE